MVGESWTIVAEDKYELYFVSKCLYGYIGMNKNLYANFNTIVFIRGLYGLFLLLSLAFPLKSLDNKIFFCGENE